MSGKNCGSGPSKIPRFNFQTQGPSKLVERTDKLVLKPEAASTANKTIAPTSGNENKGPQSLQTGKCIMDEHNKVDPKLNFISKKPTLLRSTSLINPKCNGNKSTSNLLPKRSRTTLSLPVRKICNSPTLRPFKVKNQVRTISPGGDETQISVPEKAKIQSFIFAKEKLRQMQSNFMEKCENLKDIKTTDVVGSFRFISLILNDNCKLIVNNDDLLRLPKNLPKDSIRVFKNCVEETLTSALDLLDNHFADNQIPENALFWESERALLRSKLEEHQANKFEELSKDIDELCKHSTNCETELKRVTNELEESNRRFEDFKLEKAMEQKTLMKQKNRELNDEIKKREEAEAKALQSSIQVDFCEKEVDSKGNRINDLLQEIKKLNECINYLENSMRKTLEDQVLYKNNNINESEELKNCIKDLENDEEKTVDNKESLKQELEKSKIIIEQLKTELEAEKSKKLPIVSSSEIEEIYSYKKKFEETQESLNALKEEHNLLKDLFEVRARKINKLELRQTERNAEMDALKFENFKKESEIVEVTKQMNNKCDDFCQLMDTFVQKEKDMHELQHTLKLYEERIERSLKLQDQLKQNITDQKTIILELQMKEKLRKLFEPLTSPDIKRNKERD